MFGDRMMVCPVHSPMYFGTEGDVPGTRKVWFPAGCDWYDIDTGVRYEGGTYAEVDAPLEKIPVFVRAGSVIPMTKAALSVAELSEEIVLHVYPGADGEFTLYEDAGDGYGYESGEYTLTGFVWNDETHKLYINGEEFKGDTERFKLLIV